MYKGKEWLKEEIKKDAKKYPHYHDERDDLIKMMASFHDVIALIDQLEEPEQEKVVIPQFVADWIEDKKDWTAFEVFYDIDEQNIESDKVSKWLYDNDDEENAKREIVLLQALRRGYTVEKEKLYRVIIKTTDSTQLLWQATDGTGNTDFVSVTRLTTGKSYFTEQEIKNIDERFWTFREEVTE